MPKSQPNIYDIAERAGVSIATVSRVLSGGIKVKESTRKRVEEVMASAGYRPSALARGLGQGSAKMAGIICADISDIFFAGMISTLERLLRENGLDMLLCHAGDNLAETASHMLDKRVDAIILIYPNLAQSDIAHIAKIAENLPVIIINGSAEIPGAYCVMCDERKAMRENVLALYEENRRAILYLHSADTPGCAQRLAGYRDGLAETGLEPDESLIIHCGREPEAIRDQLVGLVANGLYFDSAVAAEDILAAGACKALARMNRRLPVIGFNNSVLARCFSTEITSVDNRAEELCAKSAEILGGALEKLPDVPRRVVLEAHIVHRET